MNDFIKASAFVLVAIIFSLTLPGNNKHFATVISICVCAIVSIAAMIYLEPVLDFIEELQVMGKWDGELFTILLKSVGIGIIMQIVTMLCTDAGNAALGKSINLLGTAVILWISLPLFTELISIVNNLLSSI